MSDFFRDRGHDVEFVRNILPAGTADPVIAAIGDRLSAIVVTWDRDFESIVRRIPEGNRRSFRSLGRISFRCNQAQGRMIVERWIEHIEFHYEQASKSRDFRMIIEIQGNGFKVI